MRHIALAMVLLFVLSASGAAAVVVGVQVDETMDELGIQGPAAEQSRVGLFTGPFVATGTVLWLIEVRAMAVDALPERPGEALRAILLDDDAWDFECEGLRSLLPERRIVLAHAFSETPPPTEMTASGEPCAGGSTNLTTYSFSWTGSSFNVQDVGQLAAEPTCNEYDDDRGIGVTWKHDYALAGDIYTNVLQAHLPIFGLATAEPGKCDPDGFEEDHLVSDYNGLLFDSVPICGYTDLYPQVVQTIVDAGGASVKTHVGWDAYGHYDVEVPVYECGRFEEWTGERSPISADFIGDFIIGT